VYQLLLYARTVCQRFLLLAAKTTGLIATETYQFARAL